jgi:pilus assembly protein Flp/PilA
MLLEAYTYVQVTVGRVRTRVHDRLVELVGNESGATAAEYALLVALIAAVIIGGATLLGNNINARLTETAVDVGPAGAPAVP